MREIGRLRELTFRQAGGGTGKEIDLDEFDICSHPYQQLHSCQPHFIINNNYSTIDTLATSGR